MDYAQANRATLIGKRKPVSENVKTALAVIAFFAAYALVGTMEYNDAEAAATESRPTCSAH